MAVNRNAANVEISEQVLSVARTLYPAAHCDLDWISMTKVVSNVLCKRSHIKSYLLMPLVEAIVPYWTCSLCHVNIMSHCYVVQLLVPAQCGKIHFRLPELVCKIKSPNTPLFRRTFACTLRIVSFSCLSVYDCLRVSNRHHSLRSMWYTAPSIEFC